MSTPRRHTKPLIKQKSPGPNQVRQRVFEALKDAVNSSRPLKPPVRWDLGRIEDEKMPSIVVGDAVHLADSIKILEQYCKTLGGVCKNKTGVGKFLAGEPALLLEWFNGMDNTMHATDRFRHVYDLQARLYQKGTALLPMAHGELVYRLHQWVPHMDKGLTRHMLANNLTTGSVKEYEVEVAQSISRLHPRATLAEFKEKLDGWRKQGLLHVLMLAAKKMPTLNDWLPVDRQEDAKKWEEVLSEANASRSESRLGEKLNRLFREMDWGTPACMAIAGTLDRLAVLMRVKSNGPTTFGLDEALQGFPEHPGWVDMLLEGKAHLEECMPPSLLCPRLHGHNKATWGYACLTPEYTSGVLRFKEDKLEWVEPRIASEPLVCLVRPGEHKADQASAMGTRLSDIIARMGELYLSPEMGHVLMLALEGADHILNGKSNVSQNEKHVCRTPSLLLHFMTLPNLVSDREDINALSDALFESMPKVTEEGRVSLVAWRVDPPSHVLLCAGEMKQLLEPHLTRRVVLTDERSMVCSVGGIALENLNHQDHVLWSAATMEAMREKDGHTHTALLEGLACFGLSMPLLHSQVD